MAWVWEKLKFFKRELLIARIFGIPIKIDYRWFPVLIFVSLLIAGGIPSGEDSDPWTKLAFGLFTALVFFLSILMHELAHAYMARLERVEVSEIVLHPFGGLARLRREPDNPRTEFRIAIAGPVASFFVALFFLALLPISNAAGTNILSLILFSLFFLNLLLAVFNLFPGYPLDGGRVLRAYLWKRGYELNAATVLTGRAGQIISLALIIFGFFVAVFRGDILTGLWTVLVGLFLFDAAAGIIKQIGRLEKLLAESVMEPPVCVAPETNLQSFVDNTLPLHRQTVFLVAKDRHLYGFLALSELKEIPREAWSKTAAQEIMHPVSEELFVETDTPLTQARELLRTNEFGVLGVIDKEGLLVGLIRRSRLRQRSQ